MTPIIALVGPTGTGKTAVSIELAQALGAEIISCDAMQVYRHMTVLSQAPTRVQRRQVPHHLIECLEPTESFSVGQYRELAGPILRQLSSQERPALIVGGTGLYLKALTEGLCDAPPANSRIRDRLWSEWQTSGQRNLYDRLRDVDAVAAVRIHPHDARRIIRALEVYELTGQPLSTWWQRTSPELGGSSVRIIGMLRDRDTLYARINQRVAHMIYEEDVINEARHVMFWPLSRTARQMHGLTELRAYLAGDASLTETITAWQQRVRHYARRQMMWFRQTPDIEWIYIPADEPPWETVRRMLDAIRGRRRDPADAQHVGPAIDGIVT